MKNKIQTYLNDLHLNINVPDSFPDNGDYTDIESVEIQNFGALSPIIDSCAVDYRFAEEPNNHFVYINLKYSYQHPSGTNGYSITLIFNLDGDLIKKMSY